MRDFSYRSEDSSGMALSSGHVSLSTREIENAGVLEVLQCPGALGNWEFLDGLLDHSTSNFSFLEPLGHAREVKTALSGLFGRFVARAYATRYLGLTYFVHVRKPPMRLSGLIRGELTRVPGSSGDMPDWVAWGPGVGWAIVEAKGCHDANGPQAALARAYVQAQRGEILVRGHRAPFKRYAIATRWGFSSPTVSTPMLWVRDPEEDGQITDDERDALELGMARWHASTLLEPLGLEKLAGALRDLATASDSRGVDDSRAQAHAALKAHEPARVEGEGALPSERLLGGVVTRAGPLAPLAPSESDQETLSRLRLRPTFVGIEEETLRRTIDGDTKPDRDAREAIGESDMRREGEDGAGSWVIRLDEGARRVVPAPR